jgi:tRNA pseudouridine38-40 synthase
MRYVLLLSYDGTNYGGWQIQKNALTVQQCLQDALYEAFHMAIPVTASGRTDAGVHAAGQVVHFDADLSVPPERMADALNARLPNDIRVLQSKEATSDFDSNRSAKRKTYCYRFYCAKRSRPLLDRYSAWVKFEIDEQKLFRAASLFEGEHDFKAYCASGSSVKTTVRTVYSVDIKSHSFEGGKSYEVFVCGNGFLYNMVRTMVGTMIWFAAGMLKEEDVVRSLSEGNRNLVGKTMPANGLTLESVEYSLKI